MKRFLWEGIHRIPLMLEDLDKPVIAAINGPATGAGLDMALMCDLRVCSDRATMAESYILMGMAPGDGGRIFSPDWWESARPWKLLLTGDMIGPKEALEMGLVNRVVPHERLMEETTVLVEKIASRPPLAVAMTKRAVYQGQTGSLRSHSITFPPRSLSCRRRRTIRRRPRPFWRRESRYLPENERVTEGNYGREADMKRRLGLEGVLPAIILPLNPDFSIDEEGLRRHIRRVVAVPGVTGIVCNAHASEVTSLNPRRKEEGLTDRPRRGERKGSRYFRGLWRIHRKGEGCARDAKQGGADAILIMPPFSFTWGATQYPEVVFDYFSEIDREVNIPF